MQLKHPVIITSRLLPGVRVGDAFISIEWSDRPGDDGRARSQYYIDLPDGSEHEGDDLQTGVGGGHLKEQLESLLAFLGACGESVNYTQRTGIEGENNDLFPPHVAEWAAANEDELSLVRCELEETPDAITA